MLRNKTQGELIKIIKSKDEIDKQLRAKIKNLKKQIGYCPECMHCNAIS